MGKWVLRDHVGIYCACICRSCMFCLLMTLGDYWCACGMVLAGAVLCGVCVVIWVVVCARSRALAWEMIIKWEETIFDTVLGFESKDG